MSLNEFRKKYFTNWKIAVVTNYGCDHGYIKLRDKDVAIKVFFKFNGEKYWTDKGVTVDRIEGCYMFD